MMSQKRKQYSAEFKARVALEALREELTMAQPSQKHGVHTTMINQWKRQLMDHATSAFTQGKDKPDDSSVTMANYTGRSVSSRWNAIFWPAGPASISPGEARGDCSRTGESSPIDSGR